MHVRPWLLAGLAVLATSALLAHDLFLKLDSYFLEPHTAVRIPVFNGTFAESEDSVSPNRLADISLVSPTGRARLAPTAWSTDSTSSWLSVQTGAPGTYVVGASVRPNRIELTGSQFNDYLKEDGILDVLEARTRNGELEKPARERYSKHVKAVFQVGEARSGAFNAVLGYPAEIVPLENPYALVRGGELGVTCLVDGKPAANQIVLWGGEGPSGAIPQRSARTGMDGTVRVKLDAAGRWYVKFVHMVRLTEPEFDYESKWGRLIAACSHIKRGGKTPGRARNRGSTPAYGVGEGAFSNTDHSVQQYLFWYISPGYRIFRISLRRPALGCSVANISSMVRPNSCDFPSMNWRPSLRLKNHLCRS